MDDSSTLSRILSAGHSSMGSHRPLAQASIARDLDEASDDSSLASTVSHASSDLERDLALARPSTGSSSTNQHLIYRRPSFATAGPRGTFLTRVWSQQDKIPKAERENALKEERNLLRDNNILPPKATSPAPSKDGEDSLLFPSARHIEGPKSMTDEESAIRFVLPASETTTLLSNHSRAYGGADEDPNIARNWEEAVAAGMIQTNWKREAKTISGYAAPLMVTFLLQYSLTMASVFVLGHTGTVELGAVSLASMSANITGYAVYQGLATSLDTLCAQAYGSGKKKLVGLQMQRMVYFLWALTIPIGIVWLLADKILMIIVPEAEVARLAGLYLKIVLLGAPGYACFEAGKRFMQAQGLFSASLYVLMICAPFNAFLNWFLVWHLNFGFIGAPIAVAITDNLLPLSLLLYVLLLRRGRDCWPGFTRRALHNWTPMIRLALPGLLMVEAEVLAFEILTFASSYFGTTVLAAQSVLATLTALTFQIPFPLSIAASTRIANLIGAGLAGPAQTAAKVGLVAAAAVGCLNVLLLSLLRNEIPWLFTSDAAVIAIVAEILPLCAAFQLFDALAASCNGILRGLGQQVVGGYVQIVCYYGVAMPVSFGLAFGAGWGLWGLWTGVAIALGLVAGVEGWWIARVSWQGAVEEARGRNEVG